VTDSLSGSIVLVVAIVSIGLCIAGAFAAKRSGDRRLWFVAGAFATFGIKGVLTAFSLWTEFIGHETLEMLGAILELIAVGLLVAPFLRR
jgi:hypothetical protein